MGAIEVVECNSQESFSIPGASSQSETFEMALHSPLPSSTSSVTVFTRGSFQEDTSVTNTNLDPLSIEADDNVTNQFSLAPVDKGFGAWSFLTAAFVVEATVWGFPSAFGVFMEAYLHDPQYTSQPGASSLLPLIGPLASGILYCSAIVIYPVMARNPHYRPKAVYIGAPICFGSLIAAGFTTKIYGLIFLQGILYALGGAILYAPCLSYMSEWFVFRRGLANGVMFSGAGFGGSIFPLIISQLLKKHSPSKTLLICAIVATSVTMPVIPFIKGRLPHSRVVGPAARSSGDRTWMRNKILWFVIAMNMVESLGDFVPRLWLPTFASGLNIDNTKSSVALAALNASLCIGQASLGILSDKFNPWLLALASLVFTSLATFLIWGVLSSTFGGLMAFGVVFGAVAGGWTSLWSAFVNIIVKDDPLLRTGLFSYLLFSRGLGNILSTPISSALINSPRLWEDGIGDRFGFDVGGGKFENMIMYSGSCFAGAAIIGAAGWMYERSRT